MDHATQHYHEQYNFSIRLLTIIIIKKYIGKNHASHLDQLWYSVYLVDDMKVKYKSAK
jgi:hypothetical protein